MKKQLILAALLLSIHKLTALPVGNPSNASLPCTPLSAKYGWPCSPSELFLGRARFDVGFYGDYVFSRHLETITERQIDFSEMFTNAGYLALNFCNRFDIFTTLGSTKFRFNTSLGPFNPGNTSPRFDFESITSFSWSVGAHATLLKCGCFSLGAMTQYFSSRPRPQVLFVRANVDTHPDDSTRRKYSEWQVAAGLSYQCSCYFIPYVALKYSRVRWDFNNILFSVLGTTAKIPNLRGRKHCGFAFGATLAPFNCDDLDLTVEGRFGDEAALYVNAQIHF